MPTSVVMLVYITEYCKEEVLISLASELIHQFSLSEEDFHQGGPLVYLPREDYNLAHLEREPGFLLDVNLALDFYYAGYERGDLLLYVQIAEWLEQRLPGCRVFYGHDVTGEGFPFGASVRASLLSYRDKVGTDIYFRKDLSREQKQQIRELYSGEVPIIGGKSEI